MKQDIRSKTRLIIKRDGEYLVAMTSITRLPKWSYSAYDAWYTRELAKAQFLAKHFGAEIYLFNPIIGKLRRFEHG